MVNDRMAQSGFHLLLFSIAFLVSSSPSLCQIPRVQWVRGSLSGIQGANAVASDPTGNVYITGSFYGSVGFGEANVTSVAGNADIFIAKYNSKRILLWATQAAGCCSDRGRVIPP